MGHSDQRWSPETTAVLDGLDLPVAVLDRSAAVVSANAAWRSRGDRCPLAACSTGGSYLTALEAARGHAPEAASALLELIGARLVGRTLKNPVQHTCGAGAVISTRVNALEGAEARLVVVHEDVSALRRAEQAADDARRNERRLALAFEGTSDGVFDWNIRTGEVYGSPRLYAMLGYEPGEIRSHIDAWEALTHPDDLAASRQAITDHIRGRTPTYRAEMRIRCKSGEWLWILDRGKVVERDERGWGVRMAGTHTDISERKRMEHRVRVSDRMASLGTLAACVAHEINTPLMCALGGLETAAESIARRAPTTEDLEEPVALALENLRRVAEIARELHTFSRVEEAEKREPVDVRAAIDGAARLAQAEISRRAVLERRYEDVPPVLASASRLGQVFLNLLVNAAQAIEPGSPETNRVVVSVFQREKSVVVDVTDTGCGMDPAVAARVFEPFFTTKSRGSGVGLGLSICQAIVNDAGGEISVESRLGAGTRFRIALPASADLGVRRSVAPSPPPLRPSVRRRVLVVDDEPGICTTLRMLLSESCDVVTATSAAAALKLLEQGPPFDFILCDLVMPGTTGIDLHAQVTARFPEQADRVIFMTGGAFSTEARAFLESTSRPVLKKPFQIEEVEALMVSSES